MLTFSMLVWRLFFGGGSLWVDWHRYHHLQGLGDASVSNFWTSQELVSDSWNWKCLMRLRPLVERFLRCNIGNGLLLGSNRLRILIGASVVDATEGISWSMYLTRSPQLQSLKSHLDNIPFHLHLNVSDEYHWIVNNVDCNGFSSSKTWQALRQWEEKKDSAASIWFKGSTPRNAFHMWIFHFDRLRTRTQLLAWVFLDKLLLGCSFSRALWSLVQSRLRLHSLIFLNWAELLSWIRRSFRRLRNLEAEK
ncbi:hypothetical protein AtNW77_Chr4g0278681 [Arabidopsis thaliana]